MALDKKNLILRSASGIVYVGLIIGAVLLGSYGIAILSSLFAIIASFELESQTTATANKNTWFINWLVDAGVLICMIWTFPLAFCKTYDGGFPYSYYAIIIGSGLFIFRFLLQIFILQKEPLKSISFSIFTYAYLGLPLLIFTLWGSELSAWTIICMIAMIWINDTGAYLVGCTIGKHKMSPNISPKKSWEGFFGGVIMNIGAAFIYFYCFNLDLVPNVIGWIIIGITVSVAATLGDLFESVIKRSLNLKDFGNLIPGHGGILDRIDSLLFVIPAVSIVIMFIMG